MCWSLTHRLKRMDWSCVTISTGDNSCFRSLSLNVAFSAGRSNQLCWIQWPVQKDILGVRNKCNISALTAWVYCHVPLFLIKTWSVARASMLPAHLKDRLSYVSTMMRCYRQLFPLVSLFWSWTAAKCSPGWAWGRLTTSQDKGFTLCVS